MNRKSFLQKLSLGLAALWASLFGVKPVQSKEAHKPDAAPINPVDEVADWNAKMYWLCKRINEEQLLQSRFPHLAVGEWMYFNQRGICGCDINGKSAFLWLECAGQAELVTNVADALTGKIDFAEIKLPNHEPSELFDLPFYLKRFRTMLLTADEYPTQQALYRAIDQNVFAGVRALPEVQGWKHIHDLATGLKNSYQVQVMGQEGPFACQPPMVQL